MRGVTLTGTLALASLVVALPQQIDIAYVNSMPDPIVSAAPVGAIPTSVDLHQSLAVAEISKAVAASGAITPSSSAVGASKRDVQMTTVTPPTLGHATVIPVNAAMLSAQSAAPTLAKRQAACQPLATGAGPVPEPDTASAFLAFSSLSSAASAAPTPAGYSNVFTNLQGSSQAYGYMGYDVLSTYDSNQCAQNCNAKSGCLAFNIYFERDPTVIPGSGSGCDNPPSTNVIKCVYYAGPLSMDTATNTGQWQDNFQVVIAGSNGYMANTVPTPNGYTAPVSLGNATINAPLDMCNRDSYMGFKLFTSGGFDASLCAAACSAQSEYNTAHPPANSPAQTCQFFSTYMLYKNGQPQGQYCSLYSETWDSSYAQNTGYYYGNDHYTIAYSYSSSNATNPALPPTSCKPAATPGKCVLNPNPPAGTFCGVTGYLRSEDSFMLDNFDASVVASEADCAYLCATTQGCGVTYFGDKTYPFCELHSGSAANDFFRPDSTSFYAAVDQSCYICNVE